MLNISRERGFGRATLFAGAVVLGTLFLVWVWIASGAPQIASETALLLVAPIFAFILGARLSERQAPADVNAVFDTDELVSDLEGVVAGRETETVASRLAGQIRDAEAVCYKALKHLRCRGRVDLPVTGHGDEAGALIVIRSNGTLRWCVTFFDPDEVRRRGLQAAAPFATILLAGERVVSANDAARALLGTVPEDAGALFDQPVPEADGIVRIAGRDVRMRCIVVADGDARDLLLFPVAEADAALSSLDQLLDRLPLPLVRLDAGGKVVMLNGAAATLLGGPISSGVLVATVLEGLACPIPQRIREVAESGAPRKPEIARLRGAGEERFVQVSLLPLSVGGQISILMLMSDATELKTLEAQFVQSQKMQAVGQLAGGVAHDFNNLLTALSGHCDLLLLRHEVGDRDHSDLVQIRQNANRAAGLVRQLLAFSRKQTLQPRMLNLSDVLSDLSHLLNRLLGERVTLSITAERDVPTVRVDERQLEQVIMNLVVNARDAMPEGGQVTLTLRHQHLAEDLYRDRATVPAGDYALIEVADTGTGIREAELSKVFEPFYTTKKVGEGTGLGLSTAYGIVKQTGGYIFLDSNVGEGTTFTIYLPKAVSDPVTAVQTTAKKRHVDVTGQGVVLLVEDEAPVRAFAMRALELRGYSVLEAGSGEEALELIDAGLPEPIDIIVSDVVMPGLDGPTWVREAQRTYPDVRVIFVSGYAEEVFSDETDPIPNSAFLPKPFSLTELTLKVKEQIELQNARTPVLISE
ncbi:MAG: ATP-binding protein [Pseudomonadota bacterium]